MVSVELRSTSVVEVLEVSLNAGPDHDGLVH